MSYFKAVWPEIIDIIEILKIILFNHCCLVLLQSFQISAPIFEQIPAKYAPSICLKCCDLK